MCVRLLFCKYHEIGNFSHTITIDIQQCAVDFVAWKWLSDERTYSRFVENQWLIDSWYTHTITFGGSNLMRFSSEMKLLWCFPKKIVSTFPAIIAPNRAVSVVFPHKAMTPPLSKWTSIGMCFHWFSFQWVFLSTEVDRFLPFSLTQNWVAFLKPNKCENCKWNVLQRANFHTPKKLRIKQS